MAKRVLLLAGNYAPELTGIGKYNGEMMDWLHRQGMECMVITTYPYYPNWQVHKQYQKRSWWFTKEIGAHSNQPNNTGKYTIIRCPHYIPGKPSGLTRILSDVSFFVSCFVALLPLLFTSKYDYVITVAPPFQVGLLGVLYKKIKGAKFFYHVQDLQIEAARDLEMIKSKSLIRFLFRSEKYILNAANLVSTISPGMLQKVAAKTTTATRLFPNWVDTSFYKPVGNTCCIRQKFGFAPNKHIVLYSGAIGEKQGIEIVLQAAEALLDEPNIVFLICGEGPYKMQLEKRSAHMRLHNVQFMGLQPASTFNDFLNLATVHLVIQKKDAGDLVMPSKLTGILAVGGLALVTATPGTSLYDTVVHNQLGLIVAPEQVDSLVDGIKRGIYENNDAIKGNARHFAKQQLSIDSIMSSFAENLH